MRKIFLWTALLVLFQGCGTFSPKNLRDQATENFPQTVTGLTQLKNFNARLTPSPFATVVDVATEISILGLGALAVWKHRRLKKVEKLLNGQPPEKIPPK